MNRLNHTEIDKMIDELRVLYGVHTLHEIIQAQSLHIYRLQKRLEDANTSKVVITTAEVGGGNEPG